MRKFGLIALMTAGLALGACDDDPAGGSGTGRLTINLTDAPGDMKEAWVKIDQIILIRSAADSTNSSGSGRIVIEPDVDDYINVLTLTGGQVMQLADESGIPKGFYSQLRIVIDEAYVVLKDGRVFATSGADLPAGVTAAGEVKCPSCSSSGYKVQFTGSGMEVADNSIITIDFDASRSFIHEAGNSGKWVMHPVLRATSTTIRLSTIKGNVALATGVTIPTCGAQPNNLSVFKPLAVAGADSITASTDSLGAYRVTGVVPGTYTMGFIKDITYTNGDSLTFAATATPASVTAPAGDSVSANYSITAASCH